MMETGIVGKLKKGYAKVAEKCYPYDTAPRPKNTPLGLIDLVSAFAILGLGLSLAFVVFLVELVVFTWQRNVRLYRNWKFLRI